MVRVIAAVFFLEIITSGSLNPLSAMGRDVILDIDGCRLES